MIKKWYYLILFFIKFVFVDIDEFYEKIYKTEYFNEFYEQLRVWLTYKRLFNSEKTSVFLNYALIVNTHQFIKFLKSQNVPIPLDYLITDNEIHFIWYNDEGTAFIKLINDGSLIGQCTQYKDSKTIVLNKSYFSTKITTNILEFNNLLKLNFKTPLNKKIKSFESNDGYKTI